MTSSSRSSWLPFSWLLDVRALSVVATPRDAWRGVPLLPCVSQLRVVPLAHAAGVPDVSMRLLRDRLARFFQHGASFVKSNWETSGKVSRARRMPEDQRRDRSRVARDDVARHNQRRIARPAMDTEHAESTERRFLVFIVPSMFSLSSAS